MAIIDFNSVSGVSTVTASVSVKVGSAVTIGISSIQVGSTFIQNNAVGLGTTSTTGRNAGVSTAQGTLIFNSRTTRSRSYTKSS